MGRRDSIQQSQNAYFLASVLAAHFKFQREGFRQKDVRFLIELFSNWMEATLGEMSLSVQNVQIQRFLDSLVKEGHAKRLRGRVPRYQLSRSGLASLISDLVNRPYFLPLDQIFFVHYFLKSYGNFLDEMMANDQLTLTPSLKAELGALRDPQFVLRNQIRFVEKEIRKMDGRIEEARNAASLGEDILKRGGSMDQVVREIQKQFPYELNNRKPLPEVMQEVPEAFRPWEMTQGLKNRAEYLWLPFSRFLRAYQQVLTDLLSERQRGP